MQVPILTEERIWAIIQSEATWMSSRLTNMQEQFESLGIQIARFGSVVAFAARGLSDNPVFNRAIGLTAQDQNSIDAILQWYSEKQVPCQIDLCPIWLIGVCCLLLLSMAYIRVTMMQFCMGYLPLIYLHFHHISLFGRFTDKI
jgi:hypothetical protein